LHRTQRIPNMNIESRFFIALSHRHKAPYCRPVALKHEHACSVTLRCDHNHIGLNASSQQQRTVPHCKSRMPTSGPLAVLCKKPAHEAFQAGLYDLSGRARSNPQKANGGAIIKPPTSFREQQIWWITGAHWAWRRSCDHAPKANGSTIAGWVTRRFDP